MKNMLKLEETALLLLGFTAFAQLEWSWWWFVSFFFLPDLSMLGYGFGNRSGAWLYNFFHHKGLGILLFLTGHFLLLEWITFAGIVLFSHTCFDRILGYGLKYEKGFKFTHLGVIGKDRKNKNS